MGQNRVRTFKDLCICYQGLEDFMPGNTFVDHSVSLTLAFTGMALLLPQTCSQHVPMPECHHLDSQNPLRSGTGPPTPHLQAG